MLCAVYKSLKRENIYLYVEKKDDLTRVPEELLKTFGQPKFVMLIILKENKKLATVNITEVLDAIKKNGYYLQISPSIEELLEKHPDINK